MDTRIGFGALATGLLATALVAVPVRVEFGMATVTFEVGAPAALADDDDDDDGGGDDGGSPGGGGRSWERSEGPGTVVRPGTGFRWLFGGPRRVNRAPRRAAAPPPLAAPDEIVAIGLSPAQFDILAAEGFAVLATEPIEGRGSIARLSIPDGLDAEAARARVAGLGPEVRADANHFYRPQEDGEGCDAQICRMWREVGWSCPAGTGGTGGIAIGVIDTGVNAEHESLADSRLEVIAFRDQSAPLSERVHGTAVVAMLIGASESRVPGLLPDAQVVVADPFTVGARGDERSDAYDLVRAIEHLVARDLPVINLSLAGPNNAVLEDTIRRAATGGIALVAAVGNAGPRSEPLYPAAFDGVIAVTAIDGQRRVYRRAVRGDHVDIAAPGVGIPTAASVRGIRPKSGTSFATPFVTAAVAVMKAANPEISLADVEGRLAANAFDLGEPGRDPSFGWGLLQTGGLCGGVASSEPPRVLAVD